MRKPEGLDQNYGFQQSQLPIIILTGPSGVGKGTLSKILLQDHSLGIERFVRHTTRAQGPNEIDGKDYHFVSIAVFERMRSVGEFIHTSDRSFGLYGIHRNQFVETSTRGNLLLIELVPDAAEGLTEILSSQGVPSITFFITPEELFSGQGWIDPAVEILRRRIDKRGRGESGKELEFRLDTARDWLSVPPSYAHIIVNRDGEENTAVDQIRQKLIELRRNG